MRKPIWQSAIEILKETDNGAVMTGDMGLLHMIAFRHGWESAGRRTERRVIAALSKTPGSLIKRLTRTMDNRLVLIFRMP